MTRSHAQQLATVLAGLTAVNAFGGAIYGLRGAPSVPREWLRGTPFRDYRIPSLILGVGVGASSTAAAISAWRGSERAGTHTVTAGAILTGWIATQVAMIGPRSPLQPLMGAVGLAMIGLGATLRSTPTTPSNRVT